MGLTKQMFGKKYKDLTQEEKKEYQRTYYRKHDAPKHKNYLNCLCWKLFKKKKRKDLTIEEQRVLNNYEYHKSKRFKDRIANSLVFKMFGKPFRQLTQEEKRKYWAEKSKEFREKEIENENRNKI